MGPCDHRLLVIYTKNLLLNTKRFLPYQNNQKTLRVVQEQLAVCWDFCLNKRISSLRNLDHIFNLKGVRKEDFLVYITVPDCFQFRNREVFQLPIRLPLFQMTKCLHLSRVQICRSPLVPSIRVSPRTRRLFTLFRWYR